MKPGSKVALAIAVALPSFVALIWLGVWQLQRLEAKQQFIAQRERGFTAPPIELPTRDNNPLGMAWRRVTVTGRFDHDHEFHLWTIRDGEAGYDILTPLVRIGTGEGQTVLIDRGWVPLRAKDPGARAAAQVSGEVTVNGFVRIDLDARSAVTPANEPEKNIWYNVDYGSMGNPNGLYFRPLVVVAGETPNPGGLPKGYARPPELPNRHLGYAITWFTLAGALVIITVLAVRRQLAGAEPKS